MREGRCYMGRWRKRKLHLCCSNEREREREKVPVEFIAHISKGSNDDYGCIPRFAHRERERERERERVEYE